MKVLVIGGGGREHAIVWGLSKSPKVKKIFCAPGNAGIAQLAECHPVKAEDIDGQLLLAKSNHVDLVIVGPEAPLIAGLADRFRQEDIPVVGPSKKSAEIEGSKVFCKYHLTKYRVPTANFIDFNEPELAKKYVKSLEPNDFPIVIKANGLAAGKGVVITRSKKMATQVINDMMVRNKFGEAGKQIIIEKYLVGRECSIIVLTDGENIVPFLPSRDYKPAHDGNKGPNTGGMGAYSPLPDVSNKLMDEILRTIIQPTIFGLANEGRPYQGVLYAGLMLTKEGPKVLEFNCRFGDPEIQAILPLLKSDFAELMMQTALGRLKGVKAEFTEQSAVCVVLASKGYPGKYNKGFPITGLDVAKRENTLIFHAGTTQDTLGNIVTNGGRVLNVVGLGDDQGKARARAYCAAGMIGFNGKKCRRDIAA